MTEIVPGPEYEQRIRAAADVGEPAPDIAPPEDYEISAEFQAWLVEQMRGHVMDQVSGVGLDRMAILKEPVNEEVDAGSGASEE